MADLKCTCVLESIGDISWQMCPLACDYRKQGLWYGFAAHIFEVTQRLTLAREAEKRTVNPSGVPSYDDLKHEYNSSPENDNRLISRFVYDRLLELIPEYSVIIKAEADNHSLRQRLENVQREYDTLLTNNGRLWAENDILLKENHTLKNPPARTLRWTRAAIDIETLVDQLRPYFEEKS